jgi:hypothetical protein
MSTGTVFKNHKTETLEMAQQNSIHRCINGGGRQRLQKQSQQQGQKTINQ